MLHVSGEIIPWGKRILELQGTFTRIHKIFLGAREIRGRGRVIFRFSKGVGGCGDGDGGDQGGGGFPAIYSVILQCNFKKFDFSTGRWVRTSSTYLHK